MVSEANILAAKILIVDDQVVNVQLLNQLLKEAGYSQVSLIQNPHEVCPLHRLNSYDLILLDLQMPGMDGFAVMAGLKDIECNGYLPVLVITAHPRYKLRALTSGAQDFISKPFNLIEIKTRIHNLLEVRLLHKQLEQTNRALESLALHDFLTGLPNRRLLVDRLIRVMLASTRSKNHCALMFLDLDNFKQLNDTLGHDAGDILLQQVAVRLQACVREGDSVTRLGGDEFVILLEALSQNEHEAVIQAKLIANKVLNSFSHTFQLGVHVHNCTASIGIVVFMGEAIGHKELLSKADIAMYQAKTAGRNTAHFFQSGIPSVQLCCKSPLAASDQTSGTGSTQD